MDYQAFEAISGSLLKFLQGRRQAELDEVRAQRTAYVVDVDSRISLKRDLLKRRLRLISDEARRIEYTSEQEAELQGLLEERQILLQEVIAVPTTVEIPQAEVDYISGLISLISQETGAYERKLAIKRRQLEQVQEYGNLSRDKWLREIKLFVATNPAISNALSDLRQHLGAEQYTVDVVEEHIEELIDELVTPALRLPESPKSDGPAFEQECLAVLLSLGWHAHLTPATGDQGVDIVATKLHITAVLQCKNFASAVGNGAVQEVFSGKAFYEANAAVVVSPSGFTGSALQLARKLGVLLIDSSALDTLNELLVE